MPAINPSTKVALLIFVSCAAAFCQTATQSATFRVRGTISSSSGVALTGAKVMFQGKTTTRTVTTNQEGTYQVDLPVGLYTMAVRFSGMRASDYERPLFRAQSSATLMLNAMLYPAASSCDPVIPSAKSALTVDDYRNACGGWEHFRAPSEDGVPFDVLIRYPARQSTNSGYVYRSGGFSGTPVFVAYNLFTLWADTVAYDSETHTLNAKGHVVVADATGETRHTDSIRFKMENGEAVPQP
jgi:Carboxypeptidase regulatory-like domain